MPEPVDLWGLCSDGLDPGVLEGDLLRVVESQEQIATLGLVDDLAEQALLEDLLETAKPPLPPGTEGLHYLLASPFRYPPLRHGSRFGSRFEPSLLYGSAGLDTALAETAYYRLVFWSAMAAPPPEDRLISQHSLFRARYRGTSGLRLQDPPCAAQEETLRHPADYRATQALGRRLREAGVDLIQFRSARDPLAGLNLAIFTPRTLVSRRPLDLQPWLCETRSSGVVFSGGAPRTVRWFPSVHFEYQGHLPLPAV